MIKIGSGKVFNIVGAKVREDGTVISYSIKDNGERIILKKDKKNGYYISDNGDIYILI